MKIKTKSIVLIALFSALAYIVAIFLHFPVIPVAPFLKFDPKDVIITIGGFILGPAAALIMSVITSLLEFITRNDSGVIGLVMNAVASAAYCVTASYVYKKAHSLKGAVTGLIVGTLTMTVLMLAWNYILTPLYTKMPREDVLRLFLPALIPFNLLKGIVNGAVTMLVYKPLVSALRKANLVASHETPTENESITEGGSIVKNAHGKRVTAASIAISIFILVTCVLVILIMNGLI